MPEKSNSKERTPHAHQSTMTSSSGCKPFQEMDEESSLVTRNPAPDASPPSEPTPSKTFTVLR